MCAALAKLASCVALIGCAADPMAVPVEPGDQHAARAPSSPARNEAFANVTRSPQPDELHADPTERKLLAVCGAGDGALTRVARHLAARAGGADTIDFDAVVYELRAAGAPYVRPRAWRFEARADQIEAAPARLQRWLSDLGGGSSRRCGVASLHEASGRITTFALVVDALADFDAVPTRVRVGQWVEVRATLHVPAEAAKLVILGPLGAPHAVPTTLDDGRLQARFNADHAGTWLVQVLAAVEGGPRPLLETLVFAGVEPPTERVAPQAPGEDDARSLEDPRAALYGMINAARAAEGSPPLERDARLEQLARAHAEAMRRAHQTTHDAGDGDPNQRLANTGLEERVGENVAHAANAALAQRALWASPAHRENLLFAGFAVIGIGVARDADGTLWVCELFAPAK